jgi:hypothetical protein
MELALDVFGVAPQEVAEAVWLVVVEDGQHFSVDKPLERLVSHGAPEAVQSPHHQGVTRAVHTEWTARAHGRRCGGFCGLRRVSVPGTSWRALTWPLVINF